MKKSAAVILFGLLIQALVAHAVDDPYASTVIAYEAGTGVGASYAATPSVATGAPTTGIDYTYTPPSSYSIQYPAYKPEDIVGIGDGGYLTLAFSTPIFKDSLNHAQGMDFTIFGNTMFLTSGGAYSTTYVHSGLTVWVSQDNVTYYELINPYGYGADDWFPTNAKGDFSLPMDVSLSLEDMYGLTRTQALELYAGSGGGASYSLSWAVDSEGQLVDLDSATYIKIEGSSEVGYIDAVARVATVPEPSSMTLLAAGSQMAYCLRRLARSITL